MMRMFAAGVLLTLTVAGCTAQTPDAIETTVHEPVVIPNGPVATADLVTIDGSPVGKVTITREDEGYVIDYPDISTLGQELGVTQTELTLSDSPFEVTECGDANIWQIGWGDDLIRTEPFDADTFPSGDWSFFTSVVVVGFRQIGGDECSQPILATGDLTWDQPDVRPWVEPVDSGERAGAMGATLGAKYSTAEGDIWSEIAARFGITGDDLEWLNPIRVGSQPGTAYTYQQLNLDPEHRSDSESRRPVG